MGSSIRIGMRKAARYRYGMGLGKRPFKNRRSRQNFEV